MGPQSELGVSCSIPSEISNREKIIKCVNSTFSFRYYLGTPEMAPAQIHLYSVSSEPPDVGSPLPLPTCITCPVFNNS